MEIQHEESTTMDSNPASVMSIVGDDEVGRAIATLVLAFGTDREGTAEQLAGSHRRIGTLP
jgi:hypothetical protein